MKSRENNHSILLALITSLALILAGRVTGQTFTVLHSFTGGDGANPRAGLVLSGNTLYGTTSGNDSGKNNTVFAVNTDGTGFTTLYNLTNYDGTSPYDVLVLSGNTLYGTTSFGGSSNSGTVFAVSTNGTGFTNLHTFTSVSGPSVTNSDGSYSQARLILSGDTLFGTAAGGGASGVGTMFAVNTDGAGFTNLHNFPALNDYTNSDGSRPVGGLILSGNTLYGTASQGGSLGNGTVFAVNTDGSGFTNLYTFTLPQYNSSLGQFTNSDGAHPEAALILSENILYGETREGGNSGVGAIFAVNTDGTGFTNLHSFAPRSNGTNSDGAYPLAGLILSSNTLYGTARQGGRSGYGTVFAINTDGSGFTTLHTFTAATGSYPNLTNSDGAYPWASLILSGNTLYGTAMFGGSSGKGVVFSLSLPPPPPHLTLIQSGADVVLTWPTNFAGFDYTGFTLRSTTNFVSPVWAAVSPVPVVVNGQNTVTNPASETQTFYRLSQ